MATLTVNVRDETERDFRRRAYQAYGRKKGVLGKALTEAMRDWVAKKEYFDRCMALLNEGRDMGKILYTHRDELHGRH